jgi:LacI family transcriptional regulator, galactose operon repressor
LSVTIYDIAGKAGVSIATVSRVFNGSPRVSDVTRQNVLRAAEEIGYQPHASARSLARRRSNTVSAVIPMLSNLFFAEVLRGLQDRMAESDFDLLVFSARTMNEVEPQLERALHRGKSAGVLLFSTPVENGLAEALGRNGHPVVLVDSFHPEFDSISIDNRRGGELATTHLLGQNCTRVAMIMASPESRPALHRREGYETALKAAGYLVAEDMIAVETDPTNHGYSEVAGQKAMQSLLKRGERAPDAVFVTSDIQALGVLRAIRLANLKVPDDIRVIGFDDILVSKYIGLSTLRQPMYEMGAAAIEKLLARIDFPDRPTSHTVFSPKLIKRRTTVAATASQESLIEEVSVSL